jgi:hypothetical protein
MVVILVKKTTMQVKITWPYIVAFFALNMIMGELHEQAHITTGYFICGCYGPRDFNVWSTCEECAHASWAFVATLAGPLFSCLLMWLGACWFTKSNNFFKRPFGFSLLFANLPFARIFTAFTGGGDEKVVIHYLLGENSPLIVAKIIAAILVFIICAPPVWLVLKKLTNHNRLWIVTGFLIIPLIYGMLYQRLLLNTILNKGIGSQVAVLGSPNLVLLHFVLMLIVILLLRKRLIQAFCNP